MSIATASIIKLRPVAKTPEELADEANLIFQLPRKKCEQMVPALVRLNAMESNHAQQHRIHVLKRLMKKARVQKIDKQVSHMTDLDAAERIVPHGEVSKRIYNEIVLRRDFNLYGGQIPSQTWPHRKYLELQALAQRLNVEFTQKIDPAFLEIDDKDIVKDIEHMKVPPLQTEKWKIGLEELHPAPVGFAPNPHQPYNSLDNEGFYCYDGDWKHGQMHGMGKYLFRDGCSYEGEFEDNHPHGHGTTSYPDGQGYEGDWVKGRYEGRGETTTCGGSKYEGEFIYGRRHGKGKLTFPSGLFYEGDFFDGQPHGRGVMRSKLTGWAYEGSFERGSICGSGTIIEPNGKRTVSYRLQTKDVITLPLLVRTFIKEQDEERERRQEAANQMYGPLRGIQLKAYVNNIRNTLYTERVREKKQKYNDTINKIKEQKAKLHEARLKALAGEEEGSQKAPSTAGSDA